MSHGNLTVRHLALSGGPDQALSHRILPVLEEAFRIATLPGLPPSAALFVRRLDLGTIRAGISPVVLARRIDEALLRGGLTTLLVDYEDRESADVVGFNDPIEAPIQLAVLLGRGRRPRAWYWAAAVPDWDGGRGQEEILRRILAGVRGGSGGLLSAVAFMDRLLAAGALLPMAAALTEELALDLLPGRASSFAGHRVGDVPSRSSLATGSRTESTTRVPIAGEPVLMPGPAWTRFLEGCSRSWGQQDLRSVALGCVALLAARPALIYHPDPVRLSRRLLETLGRGPGHGSAPSEEELPIFSSGFPVGGMSARGERHPAFGHREPTNHTDQHQRRADIAATEVKGAACADTQERSPQVPDQFPPPEEPTRSPTAPPTAGPVGVQETITGVESVSRHGGFLFLLQVLGQLGLERCLQSNPWLTEIDFPQRLLHRFARHLRVGRRDPIVGPFGLPPESTDRVERYCAPDSWCFLDVGSPGRPPPCCSGRDPRQPNLHWLAVRHEALVIACAANGACEWPWQVPRPAPRTIVWRSVADPVDRISDAWILAAGLLLRRRRGPTLRALVRRRGRVDATRTHLDVTFSARCVDIRVRRLGLDLDPGWVPWLGRVVRFHYDYDAPWETA